MDFSLFAYNQLILSLQSQDYFFRNFEEPKGKSYNSQA